MPSRIVRRGRVIWAGPGYEYRDWGQALPRSRTGEPVDCASAIPSNSPASPFRAGVALVDRESGAVFRVVHHLDPLEGWATTEFWQERWGVDHKSILTFVIHGFLDAAIEAGSQVQRFRCRDEHTLMGHAVFSKQNRRMAVKRSNLKRPRRSFAHG
jgi:hypothetical protein